MGLAGALLLLPPARRPLPGRARRPVLQVVRQPEKLQQLNRLRITEAQENNQRGREDGIDQQPASGAESTYSRCRRGASPSPGGHRPTGPCPCPKPT